mmetsp:Transcript_9305/g.30717  ORF Transcript_9305/g.30717 Transcript_9305/m.30717 type:complete len:228 (+) Transcript_9305:1379-2062(+)
MNCPCGMLYRSGAARALLSVTLTTSSSSSSEVAGDRETLSSTSLPTSIFPITSMNPRRVLTAIPSMCVMTSPRLHTLASRPWCCRSPALWAGPLRHVWTMSIPVVHAYPSDLSSLSSVCEIPREGCSSAALSRSCMSLSSFERSSGVLHRNLKSCERFLYSWVAAKWSSRSAGVAASGACFPVAHTTLRRSTPPCTWNLSPSCFTYRIVSSFPRKRNVRFCQSAGHR